MLILASVCEHLMVILTQFFVSEIEILSNEKIFSGSADRTIKIWEVNTGNCLQTLEGHTNFVISIKVLSEEKIISGSWDKAIKV